MKILIYGAGVVGCSYGWQLSKAGCDVAVLVRKEQKELVQKDGIRIICSDFREKARKDTDIIFKPTVIDELSSNNDFEYIIVSTNKLQLSTILPSLSKSAGKANVVFFQNNWDVFTEIDKYLKPEQYFFAFPFMVGGGKEDKSIHCAISGLKYSNTPLGEKDGRTTPRVEKLSIILDKANLKPYGLQRGIDGSLAKHISTMQYYKELVEQQDSLQENIETLLGLEEEAQKKLKQVKGEINTQKMKSAAVNATTAIADGVSSLLGGSKVKRLEAENEGLKQDIANLQRQVQAEQREQTKMENRHNSEINKIDRSYQQKIAGYDNRLKQIDTYFPIVTELLPIAEQCREVGFTEELTRRIVSLQPVGFKGRLYSKEHKERFRTEHSTATVERNPQENGKFRLCIDRMPILEWFRMKFQELKEKLSVSNTSKEENKPKRGLRL